VPLVQCLQILAETQENKKFAAAIMAIQREVESGNNLAASMKTQPKVFDDLYTNMVAAGESGGILDTIFQRLAVYIEKAVKLKRAVQSALVYPCAVVFIASAVITLILWKVIPAFTDLFNGMQVQLPLPTRIVIWASEFVGSYGIFIIVGLVILSGVLRSYYKTPKGRHVIDGLILQSPIFGPLMRKIAVARFSRTMATLIASGVPILDCLDITAHTSGNAIHGGFHDRRRRTGRRTREDAHQDCGFLRAGSRRGSRRPDDGTGTGDDRRTGHHCRRHRHFDVPSDVLAHQPDEQIDRM
jgi:type IV pilus assembly protein PilC